jgi:transposase
MTRASEWAPRVAAWRASGKTAKEFCKGRDYAASRLLWWSSDLKRRGVGQSTSNPAALIRVIRKGEAARASVAAVVHLGTIRVEIPAGADRATLSTVLEVLSARSERGGRR